MPIIASPRVPRSPLTGPVNIEALPILADPLLGPRTDDDQARIQDLVSSNRFRIFEHKLAQLVQSGETVSQAELSKRFQSKHGESLESHVRAQHINLNSVLSNSTSLLQVRGGVALRSACPSSEAGVPEGWDELVSICQQPGNSKAKKVVKDRDWRVSVREASIAEAAAHLEQSKVSPRPAPVGWEMMENKARWNVGRGSDTGTWDDLFSAGSVRPQWFQDDPVPPPPTERPPPDPVASTSKTPTKRRPPPPPPSKPKPDLKGPGLRVDQQADKIKERAEFMAQQLREDALRKADELKRAAVLQAALMQQAAELEANRLVQQARALSPEKVSKSTPHSPHSPVRDSSSSEVAPSEAPSASDAEPKRRKKIKKKDGKCAHVRSQTSQDSGGYFCDLMDRCCVGVHHVSCLAVCLWCSPLRWWAIGGSFLIALGYSWAISAFGMEHSKDLTLGSWFAVLALALLCANVHRKRSVRGISARSIESVCWFYGVRLIPISLRNGYIPTDKTGDGIYQLADGMCLCLALHLLYVLHKTYGDTLEREKGPGSMAKNRLFLCFAAACMNHGDLNASMFFDVLWMTSTYAEAIMLQPQIDMLKASPAAGCEGLCAHFVVGMLISRCFVFNFWWQGYTQLAPLSADADEVNWAGLGVLLAVIVQVVQTLELAYYFIVEAQSSLAATKSTTS